MEINHEERAIIYSSSAIGIVLGIGLLTTGIFCHKIAMIGAGSMLSISTIGLLMKFRAYEMKKETRTKQFTALPIKNINVEGAWGDIYPKGDL